LIAPDPEGLFQIVRPDGSFDAALDPGLPAETLHSMHRFMTLQRTLDKRMMLLQRQGRVGFYGEIRGQEATPTAFGHALRPTDWVFQGLRESLIMLIRGFPLDRFVAQVYGNSLDELRGRQMPSHYASRSVHQVSWSSCIGPQVPQAVGAAWAAKIQGHDTVCVGFCGDGATSEADFHVAMNFAGVFKPPVILVVQNNHWSISVPTHKQTASRTYALKAVGYGFPGFRVDGNDVLAIYRIAREAAERARTGGGPTLVECVTYRIGAHSSSDDPTRYRDPREVEEWAARDPVDRFRAYLVKKGIWDDARETAMIEALDAEVLETIQRVEKLPPPDRRTLFEDVFAKKSWNLVEQERDLDRVG